MAKKHLVVGLTAVALAAAGCGIGGESDDDATASGGATISGCEIPEPNRTAGEISGEVTGEITFETLGLQGSFKDFFTAQISRFESAHPGVKVNWIDDPGGADYNTRKTTDIKVCKLPDVMNTDVFGLGILHKANLAMDMGDRLPDVSGNYTEDIWKTVVPPGSQEHLGLPWYTGWQVTSYNTELAAKVGMTTPPKTYDEFFQVLEKAGQVSGGAFYGAWGNPIYALPNDFAIQGVKVMNDDNTRFTFASDPTALSWLTNMAKAYKNGGYPKDSVSGDPGPEMAYAAGQLVFGPGGTRYIKENSPGIYAKTALAPFRTDALGGQLANGQFIAVPKTSANAVTALAFAKFITSLEEQEAWCSSNGVQPIPPMATLPESAKCWTDDSYDATEKRYMELQREANAAAKYDPIIWYWSAGVSAAVVPEIQKAMLGSVSPQEALSAAEEAANKVLADSQ